jgi:hypothetical protein
MISHFTMAYGLGFNMDIYIGSKLFLKDAQTTMIKINSQDRTITTIINGMVNQFHNLPSGTYKVTKIDSQSYIQRVSATLN